MSKDKLMPILGPRQSRAQREDDLTLLLTIALRRLGGGMGVTQEDIIKAMDSSGGLKTTKGRHLYIEVLD